MNHERETRGGMNVGKRLIRKVSFCAPHPWLHAVKDRFPDQQLHGQYTQRPRIKRFCRQHSRLLCTVRLKEFGCGIVETESGASVATSARSSSKVDERAAVGVGQPHDVARLDVAVNVAPAVQVCQAVCDVGQHLYAWAGSGGVCASLMVCEGIMTTVTTLHAFSAHTTILLVLVVR